VVRRQFFESARYFRIEASQVPITKLQCFVVLFRDSIADVRHSILA